MSTAIIPPPTALQALVPDDRWPAVQAAFADAVDHAAASENTCSSEVVISALVPGGDERLAVDLAWLVACHRAECVEWIEWLQGGAR